MVVQFDSDEQDNRERFPAYARLCENTVHGSTGLTTNGALPLKIEHLSVRPELRRRAPKEFSHSLTLGMTVVIANPSARLRVNSVRDLSPKLHHYQ